MELFVILIFEGVLSDSGQTRDDFWSPKQVKMAKFTVVSTVVIFCWSCSTIIPVDYISSRLSRLLNQLPINGPSGNQHFVSNNVELAECWAK